MSEGCPRRGRYVYSRRPLRGLLVFGLSCHPTNDGGANRKSVVSDDLNTRAYPRLVSESQAPTLPCLLPLCFLKSAGLSVNLSVNLTKFYFVRHKNCYTFVTHNQHLSPGRHLYYEQDSHTGRRSTHRSPRHTGHHTCPKRQRPPRAGRRHCFLQLRKPLRHHPQQPPGPRRRVHPQRFETVGRPQILAQGTQPRLCHIAVQDQDNAHRPGHNRRERD